MMMRRRGMPLVRAAATTAVVAGTAGAIRHRQDQRWANQAADQQAEQDAIYQQGVAAGQATAAQQAPPVQQAPTGGGVDIARLKELGQLHDSGVLNDEEFAAAKAKLLGG